MKLEEKGRIIPPPVLSNYSELVSQEIQKWEGIISATHWEIYDRNQPNGADFYVGELELGHIHLDGSLHIASTKELSQTLIKSELARKFPYGENWIQFKISDQESVHHAIWLFKLHYDNLRDVDTAKLLKAIQITKAEFEHSHSFSKLFKSKTNQTPPEYRQSFNKKLDV